MRLQYINDIRHYHTNKFYTVIRKDGVEFDIPGNIVTDHLKRGFTLKHAPFVCIEEAVAKKTQYVVEETITEVEVPKATEDAPEDLNSALNKLRRQDLMKLAKEEGHKINLSMKKADLIALLS